MKHGKHYVDSAKLVDRTKLYEADEALSLCCQTAKAMHAVRIASMRTSIFARTKAAEDANMRAA